MSTPDAALEPFAALIGAWDTAATHPGFEAVVPGITTFEWLEGRQFVLQRSHNDDAAFPDALSVIGAPEAGGGLVAEYFDSRGVRRTYGVALQDGVLRLWREQPGFDQRFAARLGPDAFDGLWETAETPGAWRDDLAVAYRRRGLAGKS